MAAAGSVPVSSVDVQLSVVTSAAAHRPRQAQAQGMQVSVGNSVLQQALPLLPSQPGVPTRKTQVPLLLYSPQVRTCLLPFVDVYCVHASIQLYLSCSLLILRASSEAITPMSS